MRTHWEREREREREQTEDLDRNLGEKNLRSSLWTRETRATFMNAALKNNPEPQYEKNHGDITAKVFRPEPFIEP